MIGNDNLLCVNAHIAHDVIVGNHTHVGNNAILGGHVTVEDYAGVMASVCHSPILQGRRIQPTSVVVLLW